MTGEFDIIKKYFTFSETRDDVVLAGGDDCAIVSPAENKQIVVTADTLISGVHFPENTSPEDIAYKALMVNLSDLAAMGATPAWITLAISLPEVDENWLRRFSNTLSATLNRFNISLIGGDTTKGGLSITIQAMGLCETGKSLRRDSAVAGDRIYITGNLGDAAIGLKSIIDKLDDEKLQPCIEKLNRPEARIKFAEQLLKYSKCAIDISDGLLADLAHITDSSRCGARIMLSDIPLSSSARYYFRQYNNNVIDWELVSTQGDDYELCFTLSEENVSAINKLAEKHDLKISCIGEVIAENEMLYVNEAGNTVDFKRSGFKHF